MRTGAIDRALAYFDDERDGYFKELSELVAIPTESQNPARLPEMRAYLEGPIGTRLARIGYALRIYDNPLPGCGPVLLATRIEDAALPTYICYGHGDVVLGMEGRWANGRDPWTLSFEGDRVYGRGVVDNKGQHLVHIAAIEQVLAERGRLGFNHKFLIEMGEENGSKGLREIVEANKADFAAAITVASSVIGPLIPPSIGLVLYAFLAQQSIERMFIAGLIPGILVGLALMLYIRIRAQFEDFPTQPRASAREVVATARHGFLALVAPAIKVFFRHF